MIKNKSNKKGMKEICEDILEKHGAEETSIWLAMHIGLIQDTIDELRRESKKVKGNEKRRTKRD